MYNVIETISDIKMLACLDHSFFSESNCESVTSTGCCRLLNSPFRHRVISYGEKNYLAINAGWLCGEVVVGSR